MAEDQKELKALSIEDLDQLAGTAGGDYAMELDKDVNPFDFPAPPDDGEYIARVIVQTDGVNSRVGKNGKFLQMGLEYTIVDPDGEFDNRKVFDGVNTINFRNNTNTMFGLALALGLKDQVPTRGSALDLAKLIMITLADDEAPMVKIETRQTASVRIPATIEGEKDTWKVLAKRQRDFPPDGDGGFKAEIPYEDTMVKAQARVQKISAAV